MVGGTAEAFARGQEVFSAMGKTIVHVGPAGAGQTVKAANQLMVATNLQGLAEAVVFLEAHGVDVGPALDVLGGGLAGSTVLTRKSKNMTTREFTPGFRMDLFHKDMGIVQSAARDAGVSLLVGSLVAQVIAAVVAQGGATLDQSAMITIVDQLSRSKE
jgi:2-hydroxy-3-oxopropionate reductase